MIQWFAAAQKGDIQYITRNIQQFIRSQSPQTSRTALMHATYQGSVPGVKLLQREIGIRDSYNRTALMFAAAKNHTKLIQVLLQESNNVAIQFNNLKNVSALQIAASKGFIESVQILECEAHTSLWTDAHFKSFYHISPVDGIADSQGRTPLHYAVLNTQPINDLFYQQFVNFTSDNYGKTPLHLAVESNNLNYIQFIIECQSHRLDNNFKSKYGQNTTALMLAVDKRNLKAASLLASYQAGNQTNFGVTALIIAIIKGYNEFISILYTKEVELKLISNFQDFDLSSNIFTIAEQQGNMRALELLRNIQCQGVLRQSNLTGTINDSRPILGKSIAYPKGSQFTSILDMCDLQENMLTLKQQLAQETTKSFRLQQLYDDLSKDSKKNEKIINNLQNKLLLCQFPQNYSLEECIFSLIDQNKNLNIQNLTYKSQVQIVQESVANIDESGIKEQFSVQVNELTFKIQDLQEKLNKSEINCKRIQDKKQEIQVKTNISQLNIEIQQYKNILSQFYGNNFDLKQIQLDAQKLSADVQCNFQELGQFLSHQEFQIEKLQNNQQQSVPQLITLLKLINVNYQTPTEFTLLSLLEELESLIFSVLLAQKKSSENELKLHESNTRNENLQKIIKEQNSNISIQKQQIEDQQSLLSNLQEKLTGSDAQNKIYANKIQNNIENKELVSKIVQFVAQVVQKSTANIPSGLDQAQEDVLRIMQKVIMGLE
ncbi:Ankyrin repeat-containing protein [Spironucleus salmonicida]|uniref:Ankyrin repeat-containing protein n=1 Tax=Spironucleus salmonicida TaxID=348837 RepID=V6LQD7_9EUKA|nr:Ankyrin repeat-containing protein [Spironucleus salmonicida]|eukprot:EST45921.1 Ankyrin repeat-containing protein [Spironucleus salmonicida]